MESHYYTTETNTTLDLNFFCLKNEMKEMKIQFV